MIRRDKPFSIPSWWPFVQTLATVVAVSLLGVFILQNASEVAQLLKAPRLPELTLSLTLLIVAFFVNTNRLQRLVATQKPSTSYAATTHLYLKSHLLRHLPGGIWNHLSLTTNLTQTHKTPLRSSSYITLVHVSSSVIAAFLFGLSIRVPIAALITALFLFTLFNHALGMRLLTTANTTLQQITTQLFLGLIQWLLTGLSLVFLAVSLQFIQLNALQIGRLTSAYALSWAGGFIILPLPGGYGVRELLLNYLSQPHLVATQAVTLSLMFRLLQIARELLLFGFFLLLPNSLRK